MFLNLIFAAALLPAAFIQEKIEVTVGQKIITTTDIDQVVDGLIEANPNMKKDEVRKKARDFLIEQALIEDYLTRYDLQISDRDVSLRLNAIQNQIPDSAAERERYRQQIRWQMERSQFFNITRRQANRTIDDKELLEFYNRNTADFSKNIEIEIQECRIPRSKKSNETAQFYVDHPEKFGECVKKVSDSPSAEKNGMIGTFSYGTLPEEIEEKLFRLNTGQALIVPQQGGGFQLLKVASRRNLGRISFDVAKQKIRERLELDLVEKESQRVLSELRGTTFINIKSEL